MDLGGGVAWPLALVCMGMWFIIIERLFYTRLVHPRRRKALVDAWRARSERSSWYAQRIREVSISELMVSYEQGIVILRSFIAVCPLLGLLGTVLGMLEVFDVVAVSGNGNVRAMAAGVSRATVSTMMGMTVALSGLFFGERLRRGAIDERSRLEDLLSSE
jgi:biopolymer transport protein ExbB